MNNFNNQVDLETPAIELLAVASKTPFMTSFKVTLGIGLGRLVLFAGFVLVVVAGYEIVKLL